MNTKKELLERIEYLESLLELRVQEALLKAIKN